MTVILVGALLAWPQVAAAQCAMCGLSAAHAGDPETVSRTLRSAILVLLIPVQFLLGAIAIMTWKARHWDGAHLEADPTTACEAEDGEPADEAPQRR